MTNNEDTGCPKSILPTSSINYSPQANSSSQKSHINVKFTNVDSVEKYDDQIKKDRPKGDGDGITCGVQPCYSNSKRNPGLSYYVISKGSTLRKR